MSPSIKLREAIRQKLFIHVHDAEEDGMEAESSGAQY